MKKRKLKRSVKIILFTMIFSLVGVLVMKYFALDEKINNYLIQNNINFKTFIIEKPKVKIIDTDSKTRPIAVSINNNHSAWPLSGLQNAYLVYELIAEGGITRLLAFYKDTNVSKIGSIRSTRHYFLDYVLENDAIFVHYGQSPQAKIDLEELNIDNINGMYDYKPFTRDTSLRRSYEHTAFSSIKKINETIKDKKYRTQTDRLLLEYNPVKVKLPENAIKATDISLEYSSYQTTSYKYNEEKRVYELYMDNKKQKDLVTKETYTVKNIIVYQVEIETIDSKDRQDLKNISSGKGYYITNGQAIEIKWEKESRESKTTYTHKDGSPLIVNDGNTWIHITPKNKKIIIN